MDCLTLLTHDLYLSGEILKRTCKLQPIVYMSGNQGYQARLKDSK